jgi:hypothetical protein
MNAISNLTYELQIKYINNFGENVSIYKKICDNGLETNSFQIGDVCITEETINGRILSGRYDEQNVYCGYKYNYDRNDEKYLENINKNILIEKASNLINNTKMKSNFLSAKMVLSAVSRNDYKIYAIKSGEITIKKKVTANNEKKEKCVLRKSIVLSKIDKQEVLSETNREITYKVGDECFVEDAKEDVDNDIKTKLKELIEILNKNPNNYKELIELKQCLAPTQTLTI